MSFRQKAINQLFFNGVGLTGNEFDRLIKVFNNFEMSISARCKSVSENPEKFIKFVKEKESVNER